MELRSRFVGGMVGTALGDAIGELAFQCESEPALRAAVAARERLVYTDDTAMAIGLAESIAEVGGLDPQHLGDTFRANFEREPWRGYAPGPPTVFARVQSEGISYAEAARGLFGGEGSFGNGAAMRIAPVGLFFAAADPDTLYERVRASASVTHAHPLGIDGAAVLARAVARAATWPTGEPLSGAAFARALARFARSDEMQARMGQVVTLLEEGAPPSAVPGWLRRGVAAHESVPFAIYAFLRHPRSFEACLFCAALHSGDRDTVGAMACGLSGAHLGVERIPSAWREKLERGVYVEELAGRLAELSARRGGESDSGYNGPSEAR